MAGQIPQDFIDMVLERTDIVEIISAHVSLRQAGQNHQGLCPFHDEKTPSFTVSESKQFYHCFGCGVHGTVIGFLMDYLNMGFVDAITELADRLNLQIPADSSEVVFKQQHNKQLYALTEQVLQFYRQQIKNHASAKAARAYLAKRQLSQEIIDEFELGYAPPGWNHLISAAEQLGTDLPQLQAVGLITQKDSGNAYDRFRDRIIFPIRDQRGRPIGFGGRVLTEDTTPKYLNSPETDIFHKRYELYGLYQACQQKKALQNIFVVEGYMDVIALAQHGIRNAVASLGTAITGQHLEKIFRYTSQLIFCFDGDSAGQQAANRALEMVLPSLRDGRHAYFMFLPQGSDPDSYVHTHGRDKFLSASLQVPLSSYLLDQLQQQLDLSKTEDQASFIARSRPFLEKMPHSELRMLLMRDIAKLTHLERADIESRVKTATQKKRRPRPGKEHSTQIGLVGKLIGLILYSPELALTTPAEIKKIAALPGADFLFQLLTLIQEHPTINLARILEHYRNSKYAKRLGELVDDCQYYVEIDITAEFNDALAHLIKKVDSPFAALKSIQRPSELDPAVRASYRDDSVK